MFDPTIFDNLKVVLEGKLYELDSDGAIAVIGREDRIDLAGMSRTFLMRLRLREGSSTAEIRLSSTLADFAGELRGVRLVGQEPGTLLELRFGLDGRKSASAAVLHTYLTGLWGPEAELAHERTDWLLPGTDVAEGWSSGKESRYRITVRFRGKIGESDIGSLETLAEQMPDVLSFMEGCQA